MKLILILLLLLLVLMGGVLPLCAQSSSDCLTCHSDPSLTIEKDGREKSITVQESVLQASAHKKLTCVACHAGFDPENIPHKAKILSVNCLTCHRKDVAQHQFHPQLGKALSEGLQPDVTCKDCHGTHDVTPINAPDSKFQSARLSTSCGECHSDVTDVFEVSAHGRALLKGVQGAPNCLNCHETDITRKLESGDALQRKEADEKLCLSCHRDNPDVRAAMAPSAGFIAQYENSVHAAVLASGNAAAATCVDCHGSHDMKPGRDPAARVYKTNIPVTCAQCHASIAEEFNQSIHGIALAKGVVDAPACTDCHGEHNILRPSDPRSRVSVQNLSAQVCSPCHSSIALSAKYGLSSDRFKTYEDSYHGLAIRGGSIEVANCASCHGAHNIKPSSDPASTINKANLAKTCGKCHPGANDLFARGSVHVDTESKDEPLLYWVATLYIIMIIGVIGGMILHNGIDFVKKARRKLQIRMGELAEEHFGHRLYLRMTLNERFQHGTLLLSFIILVITGFMLRFPDAWWVQSIRHLSDSAFDLRSLIHRIAAVVMVAASLYHIYYVTATQRGRELIRDLIPKVQDGKDALAIVRYNLGFSQTKPKLGRFSYIEKSEYWALVWGTIVMAATGVIMWFDNTFMGILGKLGYDVSRLIHYYEAWLATLAIIVWHFYYVIFNPDTYPINVAFWKGTLTEHEMAEEHALELDEIKRREMMLEVNGAGREDESPRVNDNTETSQP